MEDLYNRLSKDDAVVLLVDHQTGLISGLVRDQTPEAFKNNVEALADTAKFFNLPVIISTSFENGPNGPFLAGIKNMFPEAAYIPDRGRSTLGTTMISSMLSRRPARNSSSSPGW